MDVSEYQENISKLAAIIGAIESGDNPNAIRYEKGWRWITPALTQQARSAHACSLDTAVMLISCSYGKYQIMGSILYELGYKGRLTPDFLTNTQLQDIYFAKYLINRKLDKYTPEMLASQSAREVFALRYNGPGAVGIYSEKIAHSMRALGYATSYGSSK